MVAIKRVLFILLLAIILPAHSSNLEELAYQAYKDRDFEKARNLYTQAAQENSASAQYMLGLMYGRGIGGDKDELAAFKWYEKAAQQDDPDAQYELAAAYEYGLGTDFDQDRARKWYSKAAENGQATAQYKMGLYYAYPDTDENPDLKEAIRWFLAAAEQDYVDAQRELAQRYSLGGGVERNQEEADKWKRRADLLEGKNEPENYILPEGFTGPLTVIFDTNSGAEPVYDNGVRLYNIPNSGILYTQFNDNGDVTNEQRFFYKDAAGQQVEITTFWGATSPADVSSKTLGLRSTYSKVFNIYHDCKLNYQIFVVSTAEMEQKLADKFEDYPDFRDRVMDNHPDCGA